jgi:hypothetical protein
LGVSHKFPHEKDINGLLHSLNEILKLPSGRQRDCRWLEHNECTENKFATGSCSERNTLLNKAQIIFNGDKSGVQLINKAGKL